MTRRVVQVAVATRDLEASERFYTERLGLTFLFRKPNIVALGAGEVRLLLSGSPEAHADEHQAVMFYLEAAPIEKVYARVASGGVPPVRVAEMNGVSIWIATIVDPSSHRVGLIEQRASVGTTAPTGRDVDA